MAICKHLFSYPATTSPSYLNIPACTLRHPYLILWVHHNYTLLLPFSKKSQLSPSPPSLLTLILAHCYFTAWHPTITSRHKPRNIGSKYWHKTSSLRGRGQLTTSILVLDWYLLYCLPKGWKAILTVVEFELMFKLRAQRRTQCRWAFRPEC